MILCGALETLLHLAKVHRRLRTPRNLGDTQSWGKLKTQSPLQIAPSCATGWLGQEPYTRLDLKDVASDMTDDGILDDANVLEVS